MITVKCIFDLTEKGLDGNTYEFKRGEMYRLTIVGYYFIEIGHTQVLIKKRSKLYKHFMIVC